MELNKHTIAENTIDAYVQATEMFNNNLRVHTFAVVTAVYPDGMSKDNGDPINRYKYTIDAQPVVQEFIIKFDKGENVVDKIKLPVIKNIPYLKGLGTPNVGDYCVLLHLDRDISNIKTSGNPEFVNSNSEIRQLSNCVAICGFLGE